MLFNGFLMFEVLVSIRFLKNKDLSFGRINTTQNGRVLCM